jgi:hypothetical protein
MIGNSITKHVSFDIYIYIYVYMVSLLSPLVILMSIGTVETSI